MEETVLQNKADMLLFPFAPCYTLKVYSFKCASCGYESRHVLGTPDMDQTLTDVNTNALPTVPSWRKSSDLLKPSARAAVKSST
jgi:hypothetical protein